ncbi:YihY/virulence factor BrkB family protein [Pilimelia columellifera]|uniref:YihY/virulence factor BrkB family protein n=1 Tax=Pilimelia columellifera subsp. columellifera TaxID=706583 RepID=A0ABP6A9Z2_9ACTN
MTDTHSAATSRQDATGPRPTPGRDGLPGPDIGPDAPTRLDRRAWWTAARDAFMAVPRDKLTDRAAALTYYGVLSIFPGLLVLVSVLGLLDDQAADAVVREATAVAPAEVKSLIDDSLTELRASQTAGLMAVVGVLGALWAASGFVGAFIRASNQSYRTPEGRPFWKTAFLQVVVTVVVGTMAVVATGMLIVSGPVAEWVGRLLGVGGGAVTFWNIAKWPVLLGLVSVIVATLYRASPNARQGGFHWVSPGGVMAVVVWVLMSAGFSMYVANFGSYNRTYGAVASVIVFLVWLWLSNIALLVGVELDARLERARIAAAGYHPSREPFLQMRDDSAVT